MPPPGVLGLPGVRHSLTAPNIAETDGRLADGGSEWQVPAASPGSPRARLWGAENLARPRQARTRTKGAGVGWGGQLHTRPLSEPGQRGLAQACGWGEKGRGCSETSLCLHSLPQQTSSGLPFQARPRVRHREQRRVRNCFCPQGALSSLTVVQLCVGRVR